MPVAALCPSCGKPLSETSVVAGAPHCTGCGSWIVGVNGTLGLTGAYGVGDPALTRRRVEADLAVLSEYQSRYTGMLEDGKQRLNWNSQRYAVLLQPPELLQLREVPPLWKSVGIGLLLLPALGIIIIIVLVVIAFVLDISGTRTTVTAFGIHSLYPNSFVEHLNMIAALLFWGPSVLVVLSGAFRHFSAMAANGNRPLENARRKEAFEKEQAAEMKIAERKKAAEDHRMRVQIRELEGEIKAVSEKAADVRRILATL